MDVVKADIPLLFGLHVLEEEGIYVTNVTNKLLDHYEGWEMELVRNFGHFFLV